MKGIWWYILSKIKLLCIEFFINNLDYDKANVIAHLLEEKISKNVNIFSVTWYYDYTLEKMFIVFHIEILTMQPVENLVEVLQKSFKELRIELANLNQEENLVKTVLSLLNGVVEETPYLFYLMPKIASYDHYMILDINECRVLQVEW